MPPGYAPADFVFLLPEMLLAAGSILVLALDAAGRRGALAPAASRGAIDRALAWLTGGVLAAAALALVPAAGENTTIALGLLAIDGFGLFFRVLFLLAAAITVMMSPRYLDAERVRAGEYYFLILCATLGMMVLAGGIDLITIFVGLETMAVSFYVLAGFVRRSRRSNEAAIKYFLLGTFSLAILLYGMSLLYGLTGSTHVRAIALSLAAGENGLVLPLAVMLLVAGLGFKIAAVPFHMWTPDVYEGAPTTVTAFLSVGSKAASFAMLLRIFVEGLPAFRVAGLGAVFGAPFGWSGFFYGLAVVSMIVGNIAALTQTNTKRLLAYSAIAHAGYVLIGVVAGGPRGVAAALIYLMVYSFMQLGAFAMVVALRRRDAIGDELKDLSGLAATHPWAAAAMLIFMISLGGIPPTAGFMGKLWLFGAAIDAGYVLLAVIGVLNSALSLYYYIRVIIYMYLGHADAGVPIRVSPALGAVLVVTAAATLLLGVYPRALFDFAASSAAALGAGPVAGIR